ncbi:ferredoxin--NADP reductase [Moraxella osloensis]|uniref:ferredoxin--NADP(+) reductase n=1 Tax=Faucicola osloensis TaxID=34062 RepID=A0AAD0AEY0_FAUOS|nr:ferredoxin--NADP reductase [Moraxella osloensis]ATQ84047.1 ferredoxin--NADP reductase [Moraxella osloensis]ATW86528.1 ferredoxin--NADP reductase [Moraxella osloensis]
MSDDKSIRVNVIEVTRWAPTLLSFKVTRPDGFKFTAGQFVRLGIHGKDLQYFAQNHETKLITSETQDKPIDLDGYVFRAYSVASSPYDEFIEFFSVVIPHGEFTSKVNHIQVGDSLLLNTTPFGYLTLARYQLPLPNDLWLLATGTGLAPFLSILKTIDVWQQYQRIILVYSARTSQELAYQAEIGSIKSIYGDDGAAFVFLPIVTREADYAGEKARIPNLILSGKLTELVGQKLDKERSHVMLCGNPQMVEDTKEALKSLGLTMNRRGEGNIAVENYW